MFSIKTKYQQDTIRTSCKISAIILEELTHHVEPGVSTMRLNDIAEYLMNEGGVVPAFKGYKGFNHSICTCVNGCAVHGVPSNDEILAEGDLISIDTGVIYDGYYSDTCVSLCVGKSSEAKTNLLAAGKKSLYAGIGQARNGNRVRDISCAIYDCVRECGFDVIRDCVGHGVGKDLHEQPQIPNFCDETRTGLLKAGMVIAVEPVVVSGKGSWYKALDGSVRLSENGACAVVFEHTILITDDEPEILTGRFF